MIELVDLGFPFGTLSSTNSLCIEKFQLWIAKRCLVAYLVPFNTFS